MKGVRFHVQQMESVKQFFLIEKQCTAAYPENVAQIPLKRYRLLSLSLQGEMLMNTGKTASKKVQK